MTSGVGKSGIAARKLASTFSSLGIPAMFLHPADAAHGDLGMLAPGDILLAISVSGSSRPLLSLLHYARDHDLLTISVTAGRNSLLSTEADLVLLLPDLEDEGAPVAGVPMASTVATIALGDALASLVASRRNFSASKLAVLHPGGRIGQRLRPLHNLMHAGTRLPLVLPDAPIEAILAEMTSKGFGIVGVVDPASGGLLGVITDGDLRRGYASLMDASCASLMHANPVTLSPDHTADHALEAARAHRITAIFLVDPLDGQPVGLVDLHDLLRVSID